MILGIGTDIVEVARFEKPINNPAFLKRCYTAGEIQYCTPRGVATFAGLFAAKEAVAKALGTGFRGFSPADIEIVHSDAGQPLVNLNNNIKTPPNSRFMLTIAHEKSYATATAIHISG